MDTSRYAVVCASNATMFTGQERMDGGQTASIVPQILKFLNSQARQIPKFLNSVSALQNGAKSGLDGLRN